jgi:cytoplasmic iron level regulating protein YaaA (DUF328/UPF0246 family)
MLIVLSPAKSLDYASPVNAPEHTLPEFIDHSAELIAGLRQLSPSDIASLMKISDPMAVLNAGRYASWTPQFNSDNARAAVLAFNGDVYAGLEAATLPSTAMAHLQSHVRILSGLYGVLRPLDRLQPYRLEMGTRLATARGASLYDYWGDTIAEHLNERFAADGTAKAPVVVNLASQEYFRAAGRPALQARVVECVFEDWKDDRYKIISFFAKRARGVMARWCIEERVASVAKLRRFAEQGYALAPEASSNDRLVFRRRLA